MSTQTSPTFNDDITPRQRKRMRRNNDKKSNHVIDNGISVKPITKRQQELIKAIQEMEQVFVFGPAGTGKTYVISSLAAKYYSEGCFDKIIITRPNVASGKSNGFFPGTLEEKMAPWLQPITAVLKERLGDSIYEIGLKKGSIEIVPFEVMRGRSFDNQMIILDEAQNVTLDEFKMFLTRMGKNSKIVVNGDIEQTDLDKKSGYRQIVELSKKYVISNTRIVDFEIEDCVRAGIVKEWLHIFHDEGI